MEPNPNANLSVSMPSFSEAAHPPPTLSVSEVYSPSSASEFSSVNRRPRGCSTTKPPAREELRIVIPPPAPLTQTLTTCLSPESPAAVLATAPQTTMAPAELGQDPFEATPQMPPVSTVVEAAVQQIGAQTSADVLLRADVSGKTLMEAVRQSHADSKHSHHRRTSSVQNAAENSEMQRKRSASFSLFGLMRRHGASSSRVADSELHDNQSDPPMNGRSQHETEAPRVSPHSSQLLAPSWSQSYEPVQAVTDTPSHQYDGNEEPCSPQSPPGPPPNPQERDPAASSSDNENSSESTSSGSGMDKVLEEASKVHGLRLTWLLYIIIILVIALFVMQLIQIAYTSNNTLKRSARQTVQANVAFLVNQGEMIRYDLNKLFALIMYYQMSEKFPNPDDEVLESLCTRVFGAPIMIASFNETGSLMWRIVCDPTTSIDLSEFSTNIPQNITPTDSVRLFTSKSGAVVSRRTTYLGEYTSGYGSHLTTAILLDRSIIGRALLNNALPQYSTAALQHTRSGLLFPRFDTDDPTVAMYTLSEDVTSYIGQGPTGYGAVLQESFNSLCGPASPYVWHAVMKEGLLGDQSVWDDVANGSTAPPYNVDLPNVSTNPIPVPFMDFKGSWGLLSRATVCAVLCSDNHSDTCDPENPTNVWFIVDHNIFEGDPDSALTIVGAISIVAVVFFSVIMAVAYLSISVPIHYLRQQIIRTVNEQNAHRGKQQRRYSCSHRFWLGDLAALIRAVSILGLCYRLNKKYVPEHVLRNRAKELAVVHSGVDLLDDWDRPDDDNPDDSSDNGNELQDLSDFVATAVQGGALPGASTAAIGGGAAGGGAGGGGSGGVGELARSKLLSSMSFGREVTDLHRDSVDEGLHLHRADSVHSRRLTEVALSSAGVQPCSRGTLHEDDEMRFMAATHNSISVSLGGEPEWGVGPELENTFLATTTTNPGTKASMVIKQCGESTILVVRLFDVDSAYMVNYALAWRQHRRIVRFLLNRIRHYKGAVFYRSGDCLGAAWNAFDSCPNHAEDAALCAQDISNAFAPYRAEGLQVGIVLHQGSFVCGTVEDSREAFATAFGEGTRQALELAVLAMTQRGVAVIVTEPVKQTLSSHYDCLIVDVVKLSDHVIPLILFELGQRRTASASKSANPPVFNVEYAKAYAHFRNHQFTEALDGIKSIRKRFGQQAPNLIARLEVLCHYYAHHESALPLPYYRPYPVWVNYELNAVVGLTEKEMVSREASQVTSKEPPAKKAEIAEWKLPEVLYQRVPQVYDDMLSFKRELHDNVKRLGTPGQKSPKLLPAMPGGSLPDRSPLPSSTNTPLVNERTATKVSPLSPNAMSGNHSSLLVAVTAMDVSLEEIPGSTHTSVRDVGDATERAEQSPGALSQLASPLQRESTDYAAEGAAPDGSPAAQVPPPPLVRRMDPMKFDPFLLTVTEPTAAAPVDEDETVYAEDPLNGLVQSRPPRGETAPGTNSFVDSESFTCDDFSESQRCFSFTHNFTHLPPVALNPEGGEVATGSADRPGASVVLRGRSESFHESQSIIQSIALSMRDSSGNLVSGVSELEVPTEINAKNGTTYLRSTRVLGKGSFGSVYLGMEVHSGKLVAIKFMPLPSDESELGGIEAEVMIMQRVKDSHIVEFISYAFQNDMIVIVMECMMAGSLQNMIAAFTSIPSSTARVFMRDVLRGLSKLHSMGIVHRDVKPQNVLLSLAGACKISDFGASASLQQLARKGAEGQVHGTPVYLAPEAARGMPVKGSDLWSCGIMFLQLITGYLPYSDNQLKLAAPILVFHIGSGLAVPSIPPDLDELDAEFVKTCLKVEPAERTSAEKLLQLPLFTL